MRNMNSKIVFGQYYHSNSWFHRLDPRTKLLSVVLFMIGIFLLNNLYIIAGTFVGVVLLIATTGIPLSKFFKSLRMMTTLLFVSVLFQIIFNKQGPILSDFSFSLNILNLLLGLIIIIIFFLLRKVFKNFRGLLFLGILFLVLYIQNKSLGEYGYLTNNLYSYSIRIYRDSLFVSGKIVLRIISLIFMSSLLTLTTKPTELTLAIESLLKPLKLFKLNISVLAMMISIALRFIPTLINEADKILKAQASRGVDFKEGKFREKVMQILSLLIPMFVISYKRAEDLAEAMEARGYIPNALRTSINILTFRISDYLFIVISIILIFAIIYLKVIGYAI